MNPYRLILIYQDVKEAKTPRKYFVNICQIKLIEFIQVEQDWNLDAVMN